MLQVISLGRPLAQHFPVGTVKAPIRDLLPVAACGFVHGVISLPMANQLRVKKTRRNAALLRLTCTACYADTAVLKQS